MLLPTASTFACFALIATALTGCSGGDVRDGSPRAGEFPAKVVASDPGPDLPSCEEIWVVGQKLPEGYQGCVKRTGESLAATYMNCGTYDNSGDEEYLYWFEDGPLTYVAWNSTLRDYPVERDIEDGNQIGRLSGVPMFETAMETCQEG